MTAPKKVKRYTKRCLLQTRCNTDDFRDVLTKAEMYCKGNLSAFVLEACVNYRPLKKVSK